MGWNCGATSVKGSGEKAERVNMCQENREWSERKGKGPWSYSRVVTYNRNCEWLHELCRVRRESLGAVCIGCVVPP